MLIALVCVAVVHGVMPSKRMIHNVGKIKAVGVGVYLESECTTPISHIDWGLMDPGSSKQFTIYVKNEGNVPIKLSMETGNWTPPVASYYITLTWDRQDYILAPGGNVSAVLTLSVSPNITGITDFSFEIAIIGTESP